MRRRYCYSACQRRQSTRLYSLLLLTSSLSSSAETLGLETSLALPALFDFLKSYTCFCHVYSRGRGQKLASRMRVSTRALACARLQTRVSLARVCYLTCDLYCTSPMYRYHLLGKGIIAGSHNIIHKGSPGVPLLCTAIISWV